MYDDASLARNTAGPAISSGRPHRPIGTPCIIIAETASSSHRSRLSSVAVQPGHSALTRTPAGPHSIASDRVMETTAALLAPYGLTNGAPASPATDATLTTEPDFRSSRCGPTAWQTCTTESTL